MEYYPGVKQDHDGSLHLVDEDGDYLPVDSLPRLRGWRLSHTWIVQQDGKSKAEPCLYGCGVCE